MDRLPLPLGLVKVQLPTRSGHATACFVQSGAQNFGHAPPCFVQFLRHATRQTCRRPEVRLALGQSLRQG